MQTIVNRTFLYGTFAEGRESTHRPGLEPPPLLSEAPGSADIAIEILREFSASELVGKVYIKGRDRNWVPVSHLAVRDYTWYRDFRKAAALEFRTDGSAPWRVLYFRIESDDFGPYVAVGLRLSQVGKMGKLSDLM
jgi:hypothetical protein